MGMFSMVRGKQVVVLVFASITALALAGAGQAQEVGFADERAQNVIIFMGDGHLPLRPHPVCDRRNGAAAGHGLHALRRTFRDQSP